MKSCSWRRIAAAPNRSPTSSAPSWSRRTDAKGATSPTRMILGSIEQDIPVHELMHLAPLSHEFELVEAYLTPESPAVGMTLLQLPLPTGCAVVALVRDEIAHAVGPD